MKTSKIKRSVLIGSAVLIAVVGLSIFLIQSRRGDSRERPLSSPNGAQSASPGILRTVETRANNSANPGDPSSDKSANPEAIAKELKEVLVHLGPVGDARFIVGLSKMTPEEAPLVFDVLKEGTESGRATNVLWQVFWMRWGAIDLEGALAKADEDLPGYSESRYVLKHIFEGLGEADPLKAVNYLRSHPDLPERHRAVEGLSVQWAVKDSAAATEWALAELEGEDLRRAISAIPWGIHGAEGREKTIEWWDALSDEELRAHAYGTLSQILKGAGGVPTDLEDQIMLAEAAIGHGIRDDSLLPEIGSTLGQTDPARGIELFTSAPPKGGSSHYLGLDSVIHTWSQQNPTEAGEWLSDHLNEPWADTAILGYVRGIAEIDPDAAADWAETIKDESIGQFTNQYKRVEPPTDSPSPFADPFNPSPGNTP